MTGVQYLEERLTMATAVVRHHRTAWGSVLGGWLATIGVAALLSPLITAALTALYPNERSLAATVPVVAGVGLAYLIGGHVAGRMAGYRTSWHGLLTAFFGLFVVLALIVVAIALQQGVFGSTAYLPEVLPPLVSTGLYRSADGLAFGGLLGMLIAIFAAWLGGLLAPTRAVVVATVPGEATVPVPAVPVETAPVVTTASRAAGRRPVRLLSPGGRTGGERVTVDERPGPE